MNIRQTTIIELLEKEKRVDVRVLAEHLDVSTMTIRRDLKLLHDQGLLVRTHGGGVSAGKLRFLQGAFPHYVAGPEKLAIGKLAATLVAPGQTVMVDGGTTALEVARNLPKDAAITVVTTSLGVVQELYRSSVQVMLLGGYVRREFPSVYGPLTEENLGRIHVHFLFIGCDGADSTSGFYMTDFHLTTLEQLLIKRADRVVLVTESTKFGRKALVQYAGLEQINTLVTDKHLLPTDRIRLEEAGINVLLAEA